MTNVPEISEVALLEQLQKKYDRPSPGLCPVCNGPLVVLPHAGGYPLPWGCPSAHNEVTAGNTSEDALSHLAASRWDDFRRVGDRRVMHLLGLYLALKSATTAASPPNSAA